MVEWLSIQSTIDGQSMFIHPSVDEAISQPSQLRGAGRQELDRRIFHSCLAGRDFFCDNFMLVGRFT